MSEVARNYTWIQKIPKFLHTSSRSRVWFSWNLLISKRLFTNVCCSAYSTVHTTLWERKTGNLHYLYWAKNFPVEFIPDPMLRYWSHSLSSILHVVYKMLNLLSRAPRQFSSLYFLVKRNWKYGENCIKFPFTLVIVNFGNEWHL